MDARFTTHKARADWFQQRTSYPNREAYPQHLDQSRPANGPVWTEVGPPDIGGRVTSMAVDPSDHNHVYVGAAGGGVWETIDGGRRWLPAWKDRERTLSIGSLALDPNDRKTLYAGTGEANLSGETYGGVGLYRSNDSGTTWALIGDVADRSFDLTFSGVKTSFFQIGLPRRIGAIAIDPFDSKHIFVGGVTHSELESAALFETLDGGQNWDQATDANGEQFEFSKDGQTKGVFISSLDYYCHCVMFHPDHQGLVFATVEARGVKSGIWRSEDGGKSWTQCEKGLPTPDQFGRTSLTMGHGSKTIYALAGQQGTQRLLGVFRSRDLGKTWKKCANGGFANDGGLSYTNCIAMDPAHPNTVVLGSLELYRTFNGGAKWTRISNGKALFTDDTYVHRDHHALWIRGRRIYSVNDGGFFVSKDGGRTWEMRNTGLAIAMLYNVAVSRVNPACMGCGMQDNGTWFAGPLDRPRKGVTPPSAFRQELEGDGGWTCYDAHDPTHVWASQQRMDLRRHRDRDGWSHDDLLSAIPTAERRSVWMAVVATDTSDIDQSLPRKKPPAVYIGSTRLWRSLDDGDTWRPVSEAFDGSIITAIEVAHANPRFIYVGTENGGVFRSMDACATWSRNLGGPLSPGRVVTRIASDPHDPRRVFYTVGVIARTWFPDDKGSQASTRILRVGLDIEVDGKHGFTEFRHLYGSDNCGDTWNDPDEGLLPNLPHNAVAVTDSAELFVAHDGGVAVRTVANRFPLKPGSLPRSSWRDITGNLPNIRITYLVYLEHARLIVVSTYGRGAWKLSMDDLLRWLESPANPPDPVNPPALVIGKSADLQGEPRP